MTANQADKIRSVFFFLEISDTADTSELFHSAWTHLTQILQHLVGKYDIGRKPLFIGQFFP